MTPSLPRPLHALLIVLHLLLILLGLVSLWQETAMNGEDSPFVRWLPYLILASALYAPLLLMLPTVISANSRLLIWLCIVLLLYFTGYLLQLLDHAPSPWAWPKFATTLALFVAACWAVRLQTRQAPPAASQPDTTSAPGHSAE